MSPLRRETICQGVVGVERQQPNAVKYPVVSTARRAMPGVQLAGIEETEEGREGMTTWHVWQTDAEHAEWLGKQNAELAENIAALRDELAQALEQLQNAVRDYVTVSADRDRLASELETVRASLKQYEEWQKANAR